MYYNVNTHCNLLYALKVWNCLNFIRKRILIFFGLIKLLFIKIRCPVNVNKMCDLLGNGWKTTKWQALIKCILHIFIEKSQSRFTFHPLKRDSGIGGGRVVLMRLSYQMLNLPKNWVIYIYWRPWLLLEKTFWD